MKYIDKYTKEELLVQLNSARQALMNICESAYKCAGKDISIDDLMVEVNRYLVPDRQRLLYHKYILHDYVDDITEDIYSDYTENTELSEMNIIDK